MAVLRLNHFNITAPRELLQRLRDFYVDVIGLQEGFRPAIGGGGWWLYVGDTAVLHLFECAPEEGRRTDVVTTLDHVAFDCTGRTATETLLRSHGIEFRTVHAPSTGQVLLFLRDPAGNQVELNFREAG